MAFVDVRLKLVVAAFLGLLLVGVAPVTAQERSTAEPDTSVGRSAVGGSGFFALGGNAVDLSPLNNRLQQAGYPTFPSELFAVGGGGYGVVSGRLLIGGEGYGLVAPSRGYQGRDVSLGGGYGLFTLGYRFRAADGLRVYPQVGIGGGGLSLDIGSTEEGQFDDVLADPNRGATLEKGSMLVSLGAGLEYRFRPSASDGGFLVGLRVGYLLSPYDTDWTLDEQRLSGGPDVALGGPFVRLIIGGGGGEKKRGSGTSTAGGGA